MDSNSLSLPSSSTSSTSKWKYDVFLSFRGEETRYKFTDHLYIALVQKGIVTFRDDEKLKRGKSISSELLQAIEESRFAIVILSENYATSSWCLDELAKIIECKKELGMTVFPIFHYVDPSDVRKQLGLFKEAFVKHEERFEKKKVETWREALRYVGNLTGFHLKNISPETQEIRSIVRHISHTVRYKFSELNKGLVGIYPQAMELETLLALDQVDDVRFIGVWAMGGMGKTTLVEFVYDKVLEEFDDSCFLSDVREVCERHRLPAVQKTLILKLLKENHLEYDDDHDLSNKIKTRLRHKKILLVLDDVNQLKQLRGLAGDRNWFGLGSRIIITTRNKDLLQNHSLTKSEIYEVKPLKDEDAHHLFCLKAFNRKHIPDEFLELSKEFLNYVDGLPLALEVLGSFLFERSTVEWKSALERLLEGIGGNVIEVFEISFDRLNDCVKEIFLYIACLFNHEKKDYVVEILHSLDLHPDIGLRELIDRSLLKISNNNELWMHNLLGEMGRNKVRQESCDELGKRSILWLYKDIDHVLKTNTGTKNVKAIDIRGAKETSICHEDKEACWRPQGSMLVTLQGWVLSSLSWRGLAFSVTLQGWVQRTLSWQGFTSSKKQKGPLGNPNAFWNTPNLKFLRVRNINLLHVPSQLSNNLRFIEWNDYPSKSLPYFLPNELVQLRLQRSKIVILWEGKKDFEKLKLIDLACSSNLIISPDFTGVPNLEKLDFAVCSNLRQLHPSIGNLKKLILLDLKQCKELRCLPDFTGVPNLEKLVLAGCSNLRQLHSSIGNLKKLILLDLEQCKKLSCLPNKFEMESLEILNLSYCSKVKKVPEFLGDMKRLQELNLECTAITKLPSSVECLTSLNILTLRGCKNLQCLPNTICSLTLIDNLSLYKCSKFHKLPEDLGNIISLKNLTLWGTAIKELPSSVEFLISLRSLNLTDCKNFEFLPSTICSLKSLYEIYLCGCSKFVNLPDNLGNLEGLRMLFLERTAIEMLPSSVGRLTALFALELRDCKNLMCLPNTICSLSISHLNLSGCSKIVYLPKDLGKMKSLRSLHLNGSLNLCGNDFVSLPESISHLFKLSRLLLDGCKRLRSIPNLPPYFNHISVNNCTSLERLPGPKNIFSPDHFSLCFKCINCFKLADNIQSGFNMLQGQSGKLLARRLPSIIPGSEIPSWLKEVKICEEPHSSFVTSRGFQRYANVNRILKTKKVNIQVPFNGCDEWEGILLCLVFVPRERHQYPSQIDVYSIEVDGELQFSNLYSIGGSYRKFESHHLWLLEFSLDRFLYTHKMSRPCGSIDAKGFHQVEMKIATEGMEVEKIGFGLKYEGEFLQGSRNRSEVERIRRQYLLL
ncbi:TMV resistance protein N-like isoform X2 [Quercus lobata]|uniref:TMV resistance protein N-like isoform X2 n=1 Tax=Quercus lobata TaxID=97700 RepID=UPI0012439F57|nr:TMV resistance protein N-like isoform X2 [Quercus lobata]